MRRKRPKRKLPARLVFADKERLSGPLTLSILAGITVLGLAVRLLWPLRIPNGLSPESADFALFATRVLKGMSYQVYGVADDGMATLFGYLCAGFFKLFGVGPVQLRWVSVLIGTATIPAFYLLCRRFLITEVTLAMTAAFALCRWHVHFSRMEFDVILIPLAEVMLFYFLLLGLERQTPRRSGRHGKKSFGYRHGPFLLAGFFFAIGLNSYTAFRLVPLILLALLAYLLVRSRSLIMASRHGLGWFVISAALFSGPLLFYILHNFDFFMVHSRTASVFTHLPSEQWAEAVGIGFLKCMGMFSFSGDLRPNNNLPGAPILDPLTSIFFWAGLLYTLRHPWRGRNFFYLMWFFITLAASVFTNPAEVPSIRRTLGLVPLVYLLVGQGFIGIWDFLSSRRRVPRYALRALLALFVCLTSLYSMHFYFFRQPEHIRVYQAFGKTKFVVAQRMMELETEHVVFASPDYLSFRDSDQIEFLTYPHFDRFRHLVPGQSFTKILDGDKGLAVILSPGYEPLRSILKSFFPRGHWRDIRGDYDELMFYEFVVEESREVRPVRAGWVTPLGSGLSAFLYKIDRDGQAIMPPRSFVWLYPFIPFSHLLDGFGITWHGELKIHQGGQYGFAISSDDGSKLVLDGKPVVDNWGQHSHQRVEGWTNLDPGSHKIQLHYTQFFGGRHLKVEWKPAGGTWEPLPETQLYPGGVEPEFEKLLP